MKRVIILGNGQIWDLKGINRENPSKTFEDLFSGRSLAQRAKDFEERYYKRYQRNIFSKFIERGKSEITALSVATALLRGDEEIKGIAENLIKEMGKDAAYGIYILTKGKGEKNWTKRECNYWMNLNGVIIGAGISQGITGKILIKAIKENLKKLGLSDLKIYKAKFPGKEAGILGSVLKIIDIIKGEIKSCGLKKISAVGIDFGREKIGVGLVMLDIKKTNVSFVFKKIVRTQEKNNLNIFLDSEKKYTKEEYKLGIILREKILKQVISLIIEAIEFAKKKKLNLSKHISIGLPGEATKDGYLIGSTHYLPFIRYQDGFHFRKSLEDKLKEEGYSSYSIHIVNDGIASGLANLYFLNNLREGKYAFLGPGSGLGGFVGEVKEVKSG